MQSLFPVVYNFHRFIYPIWAKEVNVKLNIKGVHRVWPDDITQKTPPLWRTYNSLPSCKFFAETYMNFLLILFWILSEIFLNSISEIWLKLEHSRQISESAEQKISKNFSNISVFFQQIIQFWNLSEFGTFQTVFRIQQSSENFPAITQQCFSSI